MPINDSTSAAIHRWQPAAWLRVSGDDAATFLQGQFTNDLRGLSQADAIYGLWLTVKGKVVADSFVLRGKQPEEFWVGSYFSRAETIRERLESYIIADDVVIEDVTADWSGLTVFGATEVGRGPATPDELLFSGRRAREACIERMFRTSEAAHVQAAFGGARELDAVDMARRRIEAGIPAVPMDIGAGDLPNEGGLEAEAISFTKGCYLGQEVMARLKSMGQVRRRLVRVSGARGDELPLLPAPLFAGPRQVGELRTAVRVEAGLAGFAMVSLLHVQPGAKLAFAANAEPQLDVLEIS